MGKTKLPAVVRMHADVAEFFQLPADGFCQLIETEIAFPDDWVIVAYCSGVKFGRLTDDGVQLRAGTLRAGEYEIIARALFLTPWIPPAGIAR